MERSGHNMRIPDKDTINEYGIKVAAFECDTCGVEYTICPAPDDDTLDGWNNCSGDDCASYDPERDTEILFSSDRELKKKKLVSMNKLRQRKQFQSGEKTLDELL